MLERGLKKVPSAGPSDVWLGANFWSRTGGPLMWRNYDPDVVSQELNVLRDHGLRVTRSFFYWPDFMPTESSLDDEMVGRYADFLRRHSDTGMQTIPTFLVGHMSGENWDPPWRGGRGLYRDVTMVSCQAWFVREMASRFAEHPAVAGWLISNEMPIYGGAADTETVTAWSELMLQAVRAGGARQPVSLGDGAWGVEVTGVDNGYSVRATARMADFVGPHIYPTQNDVVRQHLQAALVCELAALEDAPVVLEEFGLSTDFSSAAHAGHYYRQVLHTSLLAGACGWLAWNNTDYDAQFAQDPYRHHPFEMHFGITDWQGEPKEPLRELAGFADVLDTVEPARCTREATDTALVVSAYLESGYPLAEEVDRRYVFNGLQQAYIAGREADLRPAFRREADGLDAGAKLYLVPSTKQLTAPSWYRLEELAAGGAVVYVSYGAGETGHHRGPWYANLNELFGVEHQLVYGLNDPILDDEVCWEFIEDFGTLSRGTALRFRVGGNEHSRCYLPVRPTEASVVATDQHGRPALLYRTVGDGAVVLSTYPLEQLAAASARVNPEPTWQLYDALAEISGAHRPVTVADPRVLVDGLEHENGRRFVWFVSESDAEISVKPDVSNNAVLTRPGDDTAVRNITLPPYGVQVMELTPGR